jgi:predicted dehydrogenase
MAIKIVVVGMGPRGQDWLREIQTAPRYELVGCVDIDRSALKQASIKGASNKQCFTTLEEALDENSCDAVLVATSAESHVQPCDDLRLGKHTRIFFADRSVWMDSREPDWT